MRTTIVLKSSLPGFAKETDHCSGRKLVKDCEFSDWINWTDCAVSCEGTAGDVDLEFFVVLMAVGRPIVTKKLWCA